MSQRAIIHTITPGDHFSPRTGSAIPTVVDGLASAALAAGGPRHSVVIDRSTYVPRYPSADILEYEGVRCPRRGERNFDLLRGRLGGERTAGASYYRPIADAVSELSPSIVLAHNAPLLPWLLRGTEHRVVLYARRGGSPTASVSCATARMCTVSCREPPRPAHPTRQRPGPSESCSSDA